MFYTWHTVPHWIIQQRALSSLFVQYTRYWTWNLPCCRHLVQRSLDRPRSLWADPKGTRVSMGNRHQSISLWNLFCSLVDFAIINCEFTLRVIAGFPLFSSHKFPWLFQYFFHFSLTFIKYFYGFYSILLHAVKYSFYNKNIYFTLSKILSWNSNNLTLNTLWACSWEGVVHTLPKKREFWNRFCGKNSVIF